MPKYNSQQDQLFQALADPTRRGVLEHLSHGVATVGQLSAAFKMTLPSFMQHLQILEQSGLVKSNKTGRIRTYELEPQGIQQVENWLVQQRRIWTQRLDQLDQYLLEQKEQENIESPDLPPPIQKGDRP